MSSRIVVISTEAAIEALTILREWRAVPHIREQEGSMVRRMRALIALEERADRLLARVYR